MALLVAGLSPSHGLPTSLAVGYNPLLGASSRPRETRGSTHAFFFFLFFFFSFFLLPFCWPPEPSIASPASSGDIHVGLRHMVVPLRPPRGRETRPQSGLYPTAKLVGRPWGRGGQARTRGARQGSRGRWEAVIGTADSGRFHNEVNPTQFPPGTLRGRAGARVPARHHRFLGAGVQRRSRVSVLSRSIATSSYVSVAVPVCASPMFPAASINFTVNVRTPERERRDIDAGDLLRCRRDRAGYGGEAAAAAWHGVLVRRARGRLGVGDGDAGVRADC